MDAPGRTGLAVPVQPYVRELSGDAALQEAVAEPAFDALMEFYSPTRAWGLRALGFGGLGSRAWGQGFGLWGFGSVGGQGVGSSTPSVSAWV